LLILVQVNPLLIESAYNIIETGHNFFTLIWVIKNTNSILRFKKIAIPRQRSWKYDWVLEFDIKGLFDNIDYELLMKAVRQHTDNAWNILYIQRWLKAPFQMPDGTLKERNKGTPQGGVISPVLASLFLHYAFDKWMDREHPDKLRGSCPVLRGPGGAIPPGYSPSKMCIEHDNPWNTYGLYQNFFLTKEKFSKPFLDP
jgi:retron-type reverse transcriptase